MTPAGEAGTLSSLRALLDVAAVVRSRADLQHLFDEIASTVAQALGFLAVVVNLYRPAWDDDEVVSSRVRTPPRAGARRHVNPEELARRPTSASAYAGPTSSRRRVRVQAARRRWVEGTAGPATTRTPGTPRTRCSCRCARPRGELLGILSVDEPVDGRRPDRRAPRPARRRRRARRARARARPAGGRGRAPARRRRPPAARLAGSSTSGSRRDEMLDAVCAGIRDALGFEKVACRSTSGAAARCRAPRVGCRGASPLGPLPRRPRSRDCSAPELEHEGGVLLERAEAQRRGDPAASTVYAPPQRPRPARLGPPLAARPAARPRGPAARRAVGRRPGRPPAARRRSACRRCARSPTRR